MDLLFESCTTGARGRLRSTIVLVMAKRLDPPASIMRGCLAPAVPIIMSTTQTHAQHRTRLRANEQRVTKKFISKIAQVAARCL